MTHAMCLISVQFSAVHAFSMQTLVTHITETHQAASEW
jgi:hypothetical protein